MQWLLVLPPLLLLAFATAPRSGESARPVCADSSAPCPHLATLLADDLGWYDTTINNPDAPTPQISALLAEGFRLERHYVYRYCSPTRRSMLSGRWPAHITGKQAPPCSNFLPLSCALLSEKLKLANYSSIFVGKGHLGWLTEDHLMVNRGFSSHLGYLAGAESYAYGVSGEQPDLLQHAAHEHDMWLDHEPAWAVSTEIDYSPTFYSKWVAQKLHSHVATRPTQPMWLHFPVQNVHAPYVLPPAAVRRDFPTQQWNDHQELRSIYMNMLALLDDMVGNVTASLRKEEMWANTLMLVTADNGGLYLGNNHGLRGHKYDPWDGGTRAAAFLTGGFLPAHLRGSSSGDKYVHISDWFATFCYLAHVDPTDNVELNGTVRPLDSVDVWPMLTGQASTRPGGAAGRFIIVTEASVIDTVTGYKLLTLAGPSRYYLQNSSAVDPSLPGATGYLPCLSGHSHPTWLPHNHGSVTATHEFLNQLCNGEGLDPAHLEKSTKNCACAVCNSTHPCLVALNSDPAETTNVAALYPAVVETLQAKLLADGSAYIDGTMDPEVLERDYVKIHDPDAHWKNFSGPCYLRKSGRRTAGENRFDSGEGDSGGGSGD